MKYFTMQGPTGRWNGYVIIPADHPLAKSGKLTDEDDPCLDNLNLSVHGGITFNEEVDIPADWEDWLEGVDVTPGSIIVGFDTNHSGDRAEDWPREKVQEEARRLMSQLKSLVLESDHERAGLLTDETSK